MPALSMTRARALYRRWYSSLEKRGMSWSKIACNSGGRLSVCMMSRGLVRRERARVICAFAAWNCDIKSRIIPICHERRKAMVARLKLRRVFAFCLACASIFVCGQALALDYPTRPVRWLVGYPAGGTTDILARIIGHWLSEHLGQQFIVENKPGAGNNIATEAMINSSPDGYTV